MNNLTWYTDTRPSKNSISSMFIKHTEPFYQYDPITANSVVQTTNMLEAKLLTKTRRKLNNQPMRGSFYLSAVTGHPTPVIEVP